MSSFYFKTKKRMIAWICAITMVVAGLAVAPKTVVADEEAGTTAVDWSNITEWTRVGETDIYYSITNAKGMFNRVNVANSELFYFITNRGGFTATITGPKTDDVVEKKCSGAEIELRKSDFPTDGYYTIDTTGLDGLQIAVKRGGSSSGGGEVSAPKAPTNLEAHIGGANTFYTIAFTSVDGAKSYKFYLDGEYRQDITNGGTVTIEKLGLKAGKTYKFGVSAVNAAGVESAVTTIDVTAPGKEEGTTTPTPGTDERTGNIVQGKIWKAYTNAEDSKKFYEISSDATNYTLKDKNIGSTWWHIQTAIDGVTFYANTDYVCTFTLKADKPKEFTVDNRPGDEKIFVESEGKGWQEAEDGTYFYKYKGTFASTTKQDLNVRIALGYHNGKDKKTDSNYSVNDIATFKMSNFQIVKASEYKDDTYTVSIDGTKVGSAEPDNTYTLPTEAKYGYYDTVNKKIYKAGSKITVNDDVNLVSITNVSVKMYDGAAIRIAANEKTPGGIRFKASVDVTCGVAEYKNEITNKVQAGTLITTKDILDAKNDVEYNVENVNNIGKVLDVENTGWLDEDTHSYSASLINIVKANYDRYFVAKAYVKVPYVKAAAEYVYSADDSGNSCANSVKRSISDVATAIKGNGEYDGITNDTIKKLIDSFIVTK
ncbi:hypothetical protein [Eubacterium ventriosum]|uniref:hypothetical protein n=1 Tax=Eubacterium ventriosum TaxID=39496 RepID=UPI002671F518|nr:hypothetical protein [Eubacterium ventriosum]